MNNNINDKTINEIEDDVYNKINFNALAWDAPNHNGRREYVPENKMYKYIVRWLNTATKTIWDLVSTTDENNVSCHKKRLSFDNGIDVIATYYSDTEGIMWYFQKANEYKI